MSVNRIENIVQQHKINKLKEDGKILQGTAVVRDNNYKYEFTCKLICANYANIQSIEPVKVSVELLNEGNKFILLNHRVESKVGFHVLPGQVPVMVELVTGYSLGDAHILSVTLVARVLNCSEKFVHQLIQNGELNVDTTLHEVLAYKKKDDAKRQEALQLYLEETADMQ